jgi:preprotein translocase subunit SecY
MRKMIIELDKKRVLKTVTICGGFVGGTILVMSTMLIHCMFPLFLWCISVAVMLVIGVYKEFTQ